MSQKMALQAGGFNLLGVAPLATADNPTKILCLNQVPVLLIQFCFLCSSYFSSLFTVGCSFSIAKAVTIDECTGSECTGSQ